MLSDMTFLKICFELMFGQRFLDGVKENSKICIELMFGHMEMILKILRDFKKGAANLRKCWDFRTFFSVICGPELKFCMPV